MLSTLKHSFNYLISNLATALLGLISIPLMTRLLTPNDYGIVRVFSSYVGIGVCILPLYTFGATGRYYYEEKKDFKDFFGTMTILSLSIFFLMTSLCLLAGPWLVKLMNIPWNAYLCIFPLCLSSIVFRVFFEIKQAQKESKELAIVEILRGYSYLGLFILIIWFFETRKYLAPIIAQVIIAVILMGYMIKQLKPYLKRAFKKDHVKYILRYTLPFLPMSMSGIILEKCDLIMINHYKGSGDAGMYALAYTMGNLFWILICSFLTAWLPDLYKYTKNGDHAKYDSDVAILIRIFVLFAAVIIFFGEDLGRILASKSFRPSLHLIPIIVISYLFWGIHDFYKNNILYAKKTYIFMIRDISASAINIILNLIYIPKYGYVAGAYTTAISFGFMLVYIWVVNKFFLKQYSTPLNVISMPLLLLAVSTVIYYFFYFKGLDIFSFFIIKVLSITLLSFLIFWKHRNGIISFISQYMRIGVPKAHA